LQKRDDLDITEGPHPKEEDSNMKTTEPWAMIAEEQTLKLEIERTPSWLP